MEEIISLLGEHIIAILGAILCACFVAYLSWRSNSKARRANAGSIFRAAVMLELGSIYPNPPEWPKNIDNFLRERFTNLQIAISNFRPYLPWWKRMCFDRAWFHYRCATRRKVDIQCYHHYMAFGDNPNYKKNFYDNVSHLLSFANET